MKKKIAFILLSFFMLQWVGGYIFFATRLMAIRKEMRRVMVQLPERKAEKIFIKKAQENLIDWEENELSWEGKMYDIFKTEKHAQGYLVMALHDPSRRKHSIIFG